MWNYNKLIIYEIDNYDIINIIDLIVRIKLSENNFQY